MTPALSRRNTEVLLDMAVGNQGDILGYHDFGGSPDGDDDHPLSEDCRLFLAELGHDALCGNQDGVRRQVMKWPTLRRMDVVTAGLLAHKGIDAACALAIHDALGKRGVDIEIIDGDDDELVVEARQNVWIIRLGGGVVWNSSGLIQVPCLPEIVRDAVAGQHLATLIDHPALRPHDLVIREVGSSPEFMTVSLVEPPLDSLLPRDIDDIGRTVKAS